MKKVMVMIGGVSAGSLNRRFFEAVATLAAESSAVGSGGAGGAGGDASDSDSTLEFRIFDIASLPHYSQDLESAPPAGVVALGEAARAADAVLIVTPEYNRSIPGVLKNALDWGSRLPEGNVWAHKPTAIMGATPGAIGTFGAQQHLRNILSWLDMPTMDQPTVYFNATIGMTDAAGKTGAAGDRLTDSSAAFMRKFLAAFEAWIARFS